MRRKKEEAAAREERAKKEATSAPPGFRRMPEEERFKTLEFIKEGEFSSQIDVFYNSIQFLLVGRRQSQKNTFKSHNLRVNRGGRILSNTANRVNPVCVQSRLEDISRWSFNNKGREPVPGPINSNAEDSLCSVQLEAPVVQF